MVVLINDPTVMGDHTNGPILNAISWGVAGVLVILSGVALVTSLSGLVFG